MGMGMGMCMCMTHRFVLGIARETRPTARRRRVGPSALLLRSCCGPPAPRAYSAGAPDAPLAQGDAAGAAGACDGQGPAPPSPRLASLASSGCSRLARGGSRAQRTAPASHASPTVHNHRSTAPRRSERHYWATTSRRRPLPPPPAYPCSVMSACRIVQLTSEFRE